MASKADRNRLYDIHRLPCVACVQTRRLMPGGPVEAHHIVDKGYRRHSGGHRATIPLCQYHHRGVPPHMDLRPSECLELLGPSLALSKRAFLVRFGSERSLLERTDRMLEAMRNDETLSLPM